MGTGLAFVFQRNKFVFIFAGLMLLVGAAYFSYQLVDEAFLPEKEAAAKVVRKQHVPFSEVHQMQNIGGVNRAVKIAVPETWLLTLELNGTQAKVEVDHGEFLSMQPGTQVKVRYVTHRITGALEIIQYLK